MAALAAATAAALAACGPATGGPAQGAGDGPGKGTLTIGVSLSLTGDFADPGKAAKRGYDLWASDVNARGGVLGRKVSLKVVDDTSNPNQVTTNYTNLITKDKVDLVIGPYSSLLTIPASQVAKRYGYAFLEPAGGGPKVFAQHLDNLFFVQPAAIVKQGDIFVDYLLSLPPAKRPKTAAFASLDDPFAAPLADNVRKRLEAAGIKTVYAQTYPDNLTDLTPVIAKVAAAKPDLLVSGTQSEDAYAQVKAMIQLGFNPRWLFVSNGANNPVEFPDKVGEDNTEGIFTTGDWFAGSQQPGAPGFVKAYLAKYGGQENDIDTTSAEAYSVGTLIEQVAKKTGKLDNETLISALHSGTWRTPVGDLSWDANGEPKGHYTLVQWQKHRLTPVYPAGTAAAGPLTAKPAWGE
ncbi:amino acid ABC transporter substrate-binding protein [Streptomyces chiangmaiensis]|uniref:Amino acid ABC transporter substrate-binding protein n=1 Tax=Streptomyces chiangmaiensis TaxID=766497 RepID=A0ABU7FQQ5_9ACTN|nr:amino acid ABC transporter substrate-binding protein [Streptomyces chiangmaiensis]MED7826394.1 amino acid ABC transporter substrate-binding protein [Streptomyces chiangmaiensis]